MLQRCSWKEDKGEDGQWGVRATGIRKGKHLQVQEHNSERLALHSPCICSHVLGRDCWLTNPFHLRLSQRKHTQNKELGNKQRNQSIVTLSVQHEIYLPKHLHCGALRLRRPFHHANRLTGSRWMMSKTDVRNTDARRYLQVTHRCSTLPVR